MRRQFLYKAGRLHYIVYGDRLAISVGEEGYARIEARPTAATIGRLEALLDRGYGSRTPGVEGGTVYRSPQHYAADLRRMRRFRMRSWFDDLLYRLGLKYA